VFSGIINLQRGTPKVKIWRGLWLWCLHLYSRSGLSLLQGHHSHTQLRDSSHRLPRVHWRSPVSDRIVWEVLFCKQQVRIYLPVLPLGALSRRGTQLSFLRKKKRNTDCAWSCFLWFRTFACICSKSVNGSRVRGTLIMLPFLGSRLFWNYCV
jgi:hypothetical protein